MHATPNHASLLPLRTCRGRPGTMRSNRAQIANSARWVALLFTCALTGATELKVDLNPPERRGDVLMPHWENWSWQDGKSGSRTFGEVTVTFQAESAKSLGHVWFKGLTDYGVHMGLDGIAVSDRAADGSIDMLISGL